MNDWNTPYQLIIYIESAGTVTTGTSDDGTQTTGKSVAGHMWYEVTDGTERYSAGYAPGGVTNADRDRYAGESSYQSKSIPISPTEYEVLRDFARPDTSLAEKNGFGPNNYNPATNSCVDYVWKALELAGLNPGKHEGSFLPMSNIDDLKKYVALSRDEARLIDEQIATILKYTYDPKSNDWGQPLDEILKEWAKALPFNNVDPLILDLDGDGVETLSVRDGVYFDLDCQGLREAVGWVAPDDGLLVQDLDGDGAITSGAELFGNFTMGVRGERATEGFHALSAYDTNGDRWVDAKDANFHRLRVWRDANSNGITDEGELMTLDQAGVQRLNLQYTIPSKTDAAGNLHRESAFYLRTDGIQRTLTDVWFRTENHRAVDVSAPLEVSASIASLPNIEGLGNVRSLHQSMARDASGRLAETVKAWQSASGLEREALLDSLIQRWAGADQAPHLPSNRVLTGQQLTALEAFMGRPLPSINHPGLARADSQVTVATANAYGRLKSAVAGQLADQTDLPQLLDGLALQSVGHSLSWNIRPLADALARRFEDNPSHTDALFDLVSTLGRLRHAGMGHLVNELIAQASKEPSTFGQAVSEWGASPDIIRGSDRGETLYSSFGSATTVFHGGRGDDAYSCRQGNDLIFFRPGDGRDSLYLETTSWEKPGTDVLALGRGILQEDVRFERRSDDLIIHLGASDSVTVREHFYAPRYELEEIRFSNGTTWTEGDIAQRLTMTGTEGRERWVGFDRHGNRMEARGGDDELFGGQMADMLNGGDGNDRLMGRAGNDVLIGSRGNDFLYGDKGDDVYVFAEGDGRDVISEDAWGADGVDTIRFTDGITAEAVRLERCGSDLKIHYGSGDDWIFISRQFSEPRSRIERIEWADGSVLDLMEWARSAPVLAV